MTVRPEGKVKRPAYLIMAHDDPVHFGRLVNALGGASDIYVHVDAKSDIEPFRAVCGPNAHLLPNRRSVSWAGISMVDALMALIDAALLGESEYTHLVFLTGADYPLRSADEIARILEGRERRQVIKYVDMRESPGFYMKHVTRKHFLEPIFTGNGSFVRYIDKAIRKLATHLRIKNVWRPSVIPYFGHTWCALTPECCAYISKFHRDNPWFYEMNKHTMAVDEHYFHTIVGNSRFASESDGVQAFEGRGLWRLANLHLICPTLKKYYSVEDWPAISSTDKLFVRKVNSKTGTDLVRAIDQRLSEETVLTTANLPVRTASVN